jgi:hypothetical protein
MSRAANWFFAGRLHRGLTIPAERWWARPSLEASHNPDSCTTRHLLDPCQGEGLLAPIPNPEPHQDDQQAHQLDGNCRQRERASLSPIPPGTGRPLPMALKSHRGKKTTGGTGVVGSLQNHPFGRPRESPAQRGPRRTRRTGGGKRSWGRKRAGQGRGGYAMRRRDPPTVSHRRRQSHGERPQKTREARVRGSASSHALLLRV